MASSISFLASHILPLILFHLLLSTKTTSSARIHLTRVSGKTWPRYTSTNSLNNKPSTSLGKSHMKFSNDVYIMNLAIGTPTVPFSAIMDTGSDLIWTKCKSSGLGLFDTTKSTSFTNYVHESCEELGLGPLGHYCQQQYDDGKMSVSVTLGQETLTIDKQKIENVTFGCGKVPSDKRFKFGGIIGMGPGKSSLVSHLTKRVFSYCLGSRFDPKASSVLLTGSKAAESIQNTGVQTVPLVTDDSYYRISLKGISVGETKLPITSYDISASNKDGGMVIDSGTTFTYMKNSIIDMISNEFMNQTKLNKCEDNNITGYGLEHCFKYQGYNNANFPNVVFHFEGANWVLKKENYIYEKEGGKKGCLAFISNEKDSDKSTIFGNMMQQNMMVMFDLERKSLSFKPAVNCNQF